MKYEKSKKILIYNNRLVIKLINVISTNIGNPIGKISSEDLKDSYRLLQERF